MEGNVKRDTMYNTVLYRMRKDLDSSTSMRESFFHQVIRGYLREKQ